MQRGFMRGSVFICARLSTWKSPMVSARQRSSYTAWSSTGMVPRSSDTPRVRLM